MKKILKIATSPKVILALNVVGALITIAMQIDDYCKQNRRIGFAPRK